MNKKEIEYITTTIENEGFDYAFCDYSDFDDIKDDIFHELRRKYIEAKEQLEKYINTGEEKDETN